MTYVKERKHEIDWRWTTSQPAGTFGWVQTYKDLGRSLTGDFNPRYKSQIRKGLSATTNLTATEKDQICSPSKFVLTLTTGEWRISGCYTYPGNPTVDPSLQQGAINIALVRFYEDIRANRNAFKGMTFVGELKEAIKMVKHRFRSSVNLLETYASDVFKATVKRKIGVKRGRNGNSFPEYRRAMRDISGLYLELVYGWKPLIHDMRDASEALIRLTGGDMPRRTVRGFGKNQTFQDFTVSDVYNSIWLFFRQQDVKRCRVIYKGGLALNLYGDGLQASARSAADILGFNLEEFVPTVYELIPYSFLADYVSNLGGILTAVTTSTIDCTWVQRSLVDDATRVYTANLDLKTNKALNGANFVSQSEIPGVGYGWTKNVSRLQLTPEMLGIPTFEWRLPAADSLAWVNTSMLGIQKLLGGASRNLSNFRR